jgi:hypothetical protein
MKRLFLRQLVTVLLLPCFLLDANQVFSFDAGSKVVSQSGVLAGSLLNQQALLRSGIIRQSGMLGRHYGMVPVLGLLTLFTSQPGYTQTLQTIQPVPVPSHQLLWSLHILMATLVVPIVIYLWSSWVLNRHREGLGQSLMKLYVELGGIEFPIRKPESPDSARLTSLLMKWNFRSSLFLLLLNSLPYGAQYFGLKSVWPLAIAELFDVWIPIFWFMSGAYVAYASFLQWKRNRHAMAHFKSALRNFSLPVKDLIRDFDYLLKGQGSPAENADRIDRTISNAEEKVRQAEHAVKEHDRALENFLIGFTMMMMGPVVMTRQDIEPVFSTVTFLLFYGYSGQLFAHPLVQRVRNGFERALSFLGLSVFIAILLPHSLFIPRYSVIAA